MTSHVSSWQSAPRQSSPMMRAITASRSRPSLPRNAGPCPSLPIGASESPAKRRSAPHSPLVPLVPAGRAGPRHLIVRECVGDLSADLCMCVCVSARGLRACLCARARERDLPSRYMRAYKRSLPPVSPLSPPAATPAAPANAAGGWWAVLFAAADSPCSFPAAAASSSLLLNWLSPADPLPPAPRNTRGTDMAHVHDSVGDGGQMRTRR